MATRALSTLEMLNSRTHTQALAAVRATVLSAGANALPASVGIAMLSVCYSSLRLSPFSTGAESFFDRPLFLGLMKSDPLTPPQRNLLLQARHTHTHMYVQSLPTTYCHNWGFASPALIKRLAAQPRGKHGRPSKHGDRGFSGSTSLRACAPDIFFPKFSPNPLCGTSSTLFPVPRG